MLNTVTYKIFTANPAGLTVSPPITSFDVERGKYNSLSEATNAAFNLMQAESKDVQIRKGMFIYQEQEHSVIKRQA